MLLAHRWNAAGHTEAVSAACKCYSMRLLLLCSWLLLGASAATASGIRLGLPQAEGTELRVSVQWEHAWRLPDQRHDAAWLTFRYRDRGEWLPLLLPDNVSSYTTGSSLQIRTAAHQLGVLLLPAQTGAAEIAATELLIQLSAPLPATAELLEVQAVEMLYVPAGAFCLGDAHSNNTFATATGGSVFVDSPAFTLEVDSATVAVAADFPSGFKGFYLQKYEISQQQWVSFINQLSAQQQEALLPSAAAGELLYPAAEMHRNTVRVKQAATATAPAQFETATPHRAMNYLGWQELLAYSSWCGLRPSNRRRI